MKEKSDRKGIREDMASVSSATDRPKTRSMMDASFDDVRKNDTFRSQMPPKGGKISSLLSRKETHMNEIAKLDQEISMLKDDQKFD